MVRMSARGEVGGFSSSDLEGFLNHQRADTGEKPRLVTFVDVNLLLEEGETSRSVFPLDPIWSVITHCTQLILPCPSCLRT